MRFLSKQRDSDSEVEWWIRDGGCMQSVKRIPELLGKTRLHSTRSEFEFSVNDETRCFIVKRVDVFAEVRQLWSSI